MCASEWVDVSSSHLRWPTIFNMYACVCVLCPQKISMAIESGTYWKAQHSLRLSIFGRKSDFVRSITLSVANFIRMSKKRESLSFVRSLFRLSLVGCVCVRLFISDIRFMFQSYAHFIRQHRCCDALFELYASMSMSMHLCIAHLYIVAVSQRLNSKLNANNFVIIKSSPTSLRYCAKKYVRRLIVYKMRTKIRYKSYDHHSNYLYKLLILM